ncbi:MAG: hypothetical protein F6K35_28475 [Okeania sp. SIO2H7]|nr:hypothetical protein [Okeania sp. SIO2H7]
MLSQPTFGDRSLNESLYRALLTRLFDSVSVSTRRLLDECCFGIAPSQQGVKTFFIIAPYLQIAEGLIEDIDSLQEWVMALMPGIGLIGICVNPPKGNGDDGREKGEGNLSLYMSCKLFELFVEE